MSENKFDTFFQAEAKMFLMATIRVALSEDGPDLTSQGVFEPDDIANAQIIAKEDTIIAGLPLIPLILEFTDKDKKCKIHLNVNEGDKVSAGTLVAAIQGPAVLLLKAERIMLNFISHLSGIATLTNKYVQALDHSETILLDTRKTIPGLRYPEKYAVLVGGAQNHRLNLVEMLMLKDNHIDRAGSITLAVNKLRAKYEPCPPIEVECRNQKEVDEAVACGVERIMLDNMTFDEAKASVATIPDSIETEISGNVTLETIAKLAEAGPDFISVGRITHSAKCSDLSMQIFAA
ncbi:carboxylating nicotinate-nucleotide diphosphorylase [Maridesulfovibrio frigidus]|uniref:carboxylating nicotinate-nucleotide diphosphorylase n=1 Tax=Maridesulfovibrio frigidus TaxID=340956 RepID=UPI0004E27F95|nr:carboxylating nicotinate-nucleotide diphosphorylase [Maridesulfovibrio frigidus]